MGNGLKRGILVVIGGAVAIMIASTAWAWACVSLASVELNPGKAAQGTRVVAKASGFTGDSNYSAVELHWGGVNGPILASAKPTPLVGSGVELPFTVPVSEPGTYAVVATQYDETGAPAWGTPARATLTVPGRAAGVPPVGASIAPETVKIQQHHVIDPATPKPHGAVLSQEARGAITERVAPSGSRSATYVPLSALNASSSSPSRAGLGLAAFGSLVFLTAVAAVFILRSARGASQS